MLYCRSTKAHKVSVEKSLVSCCSFNFAYFIPFPNGFDGIITATPWNRSDGSVVDERPRRENSLTRMYTYVYTYDTPCFSPYHKYKRANKRCRDYDTSMLRLHTDYPTYITRSLIYIDY